MKKTLIQSVLVVLLTSLFLCSTGCLNPNSLVITPPASRTPVVTLPAGMAGTVDTVESSISVPAILNSHFRAIGKAFDITLRGESGPVKFETGYAVIEFTYDKSSLAQNGLLEEFSVFYFDTTTGAWKSVDKLEVDYANSKIKAYTSHFTTFVSTAALEQPTGVLPPPGGINVDYPSGPGGSGHSVFSLFGQGFLYYQDRAYYIQPLSASTVNQTTYAALGFDGALGISTMNGGTVADPYSAHKLYTGNDYVTFSALRNLDVYVMYDTRGGASPTDLSADAPWLAAYGFTADIVTSSNPTPARYFVETTDAVGRYKIYKKTYLLGATIHLDGNLKGVTDPGIQTNYWVIIKNKDDYSSNSASKVSVSPSDTTPPAEVSGLIAQAADSGVRLSWTPPGDSDFKEVRIGYSPGGTTPYVLPKGTNTADIGGLTNGTSYTFTIKTVDTSYNVSNGHTVTVIPTASRRVYYNGNGNTGGSVPIDASSYTSGQSVTVLGNTAYLTLTNHDFSGWNTQANGGGTNYSSGLSFAMGDADVVLYAKWLPSQSSLSINATINMGSEAFVTTTVPGTVIQGTQLNVSVAESFDSYQWYIDDGSTLIGTGQSISVGTSALSPGQHALMVVVTKNGVVTSASCRFTISN